MIKRIIIINVFAFLMLIFYCGRSQANQNYVLKSLPIDAQTSLLAGCETDCQSIGASCDERISCQYSTDCEMLVGVKVCVDDTQEERCVEVESSWFDCVYDPSHACDPARYYTGVCDSQTTHKCATSGNWGSCLEFITQCHY